jgi:hypothetical protein
VKSIGADNEHYTFEEVSRGIDFDPNFSPDESVFHCEAEEENENTVCDISGRKCWIECVSDKFSTLSDCEAFPPYDSNDHIRMCVGLKGEMITIPNPNNISCVSSCFGLYCTIEESDKESRVIIYDLLDISKHFDSVKSLNEISLGSVIGILSLCFCHFCEWIYLCVGSLRGLCVLNVSSGEVLYELVLCEGVEAVICPIVNNDRFLYCLSNKTLLCVDILKKSVEVVCRGVSCFCVHDDREVVFIFEDRLFVISNGSAKEVGGVFRDSFKVCSVYHHFVVSFSFEDERLIITSFDFSSGKSCSRYLSLDGDTRDSIFVCSSCHCQLLLIGNHSDSVQVIRLESHETFEHLILDDENVTSWYFDEDSDDEIRPFCFHFINHNKSSDIVFPGFLLSYPKRIQIWFVKSIGADNEHYTFEEVSRGINFDLNFSPDESLFRGEIKELVASEPTIGAKEEFNGEEEQVVNGDFKLDEDPLLESLCHPSAWKVSKEIMAGEEPRKRFGDAYHRFPV